MTVTLNQRPEEATMKMLSPAQITTNRLARINAERQAREKAEQERRNTRSVVYTSRTRRRPARLRRIHTQPNTP